MNSILNSVKKNLGIEEDYTQFDQDIIMNINMALNTLTQIGVGPWKGFTIKGDEETLEDFVGDDPRFEMIKMYLYLRTRVIFDPPSSSYVLQAYKDQIAELESRLSYQVDPSYTFDEEEEEDEDDTDDLDSSLRSGT